LDQTTTGSVRDRILIEQPLQPFDVRNVKPGKLGVPTPFTFDPTALVAAEAASAERPRPPRFLERPLPESPPDDIVLADLLAFFKDPVKGFFRSLNVALPTEAEVVNDDMPVEIDNLEAWTVGDRMLDDLLRDPDAEYALEAEWRRGTLPPGQ